MAAPPTNPNEHVVEPGDSLSTIAHAKGMDPKTIWDHAENAALKKKRKDPEILMPGDRVFVPDKKPEQLPGKPKEQNHYQVEGTPAEIRVYLKAGGVPFPAGKAYEVFVDNRSMGSLATKGGGLVQMYVDRDVTEVVLRFKDPPFACQLLVGHLDPIDEHGGIEQRLDDLGYDCPVTAPSLPSESKAEEDAQARRREARAHAIRRFQEDAGLPVTGEADEATRAALDKGVHAAGA